MSLFIDEKNIFAVSLNTCGSFYYSYLKFDLGMFILYLNTIFFKYSDIKSESEIVQHLGR